MKPGEETRHFRRFFRRVFLSTPDQPRIFSSAPDQVPVLLSAPYQAPVLLSGPDQAPAAGLRAVVAHPVAGWKHDVRVLDLGLGGAGLDAVALAELAEGDRVSVAFNSPALWDPLTLAARVVWLKNGRAGVAFEHGTVQSTYALFDLLSRE